MLSGTSFFSVQMVRPASRWFGARWGHGLSIALIIAAAMLLSHPYTGIRHDGTLYAGDALARLLPGEFHDDLYFLYGSQGRFTLLPELYATLIKAFGLGAGTIVGMLAAFALYLAATAYLVSWLAPGPLRLVCMLAVVLGWTIYGGNRIFAYSEAFFTARSLAEPAVLFGLGALLRGRRLPAAVLLVIALIVHPLIGAGGVLVAWIILVREDRRWIALAFVGAVALAVLGAIGEGPFSDVFARYDDRWLALVHDANGHAFVARWSVLDYGVVVFDLGVLWFVARVVDGGRLRGLVVAMVVAGLGATLVSLVMVDLLGNPFFGKLQIWRALWIMQWTAMATLPLALVALWQRGEHGRIAALLLATGWMAPFTVVPGLLAILAIAIESLRDRIAITQTTTRIVAVAAVIAGASIAVQYEARVFKLGALLDQPLSLVLGQAFAMNILLFAAALLAVRLLPKLGSAAPFFALVVFAGSLMLWDQRGVWTRKLESYPLGTHIWPGLIEPAAKVYWYRDLIAPWVLLGHGNYYTQQQGSGAVFSRAMVVELDRRRKISALLDFQEQICRMMNGLNEKATSCEPDATAVRAVCKDGGIDYVVLQSTLDGAAPLASFSTGVVENGYEKKFYLYRCSALLHG